MKKAIVLGGTYPHSALIQKLKARGYYTILVDYLDHPAAKPFADEHIQESTLDMDKVCQIAKEQKADDFEYYKDAFKREMYNHEYSINWEADHDTLSAFGNVGWHEDNLEAYFKELGFTETQKKAYRAARAEYYKEVNYDYELECVV